jgi:hypothetical protein
LIKTRAFGHGGFMDLDHQIEFRPLLAQAHQRVEKLFAEGFLRMGIGKQRETLQTWGNGRNTELAESDAEVNFAIQRARQFEQTDR